MGYIDSRAYTFSCMSKERLYTTDGRRYPCARPAGIRLMEDVHRTSTGEQDDDAMRNKQTQKYDGKCSKRPEDGGGGNCGGYERAFGNH